MSKTHLRLHNIEDRRLKSPARHPVEQRAMVRGQPSSLKGLETLGGMAQCW